MKNNIIFFIAIILLTSCSDQQSESYLKEGKYQEAISWFESNPNPYAFASNRFDKKNALDFVRSLYKKGCMKVYVMGIYDEEWRIKEEGGPYADTLVVILPKDLESRKEIFKIHAKESISEGFDPEKDVGQKELLFWWD